MDKTVVVPVEPTEQMKEAGAKAIQDNGGEGAFDMLVTDAMVAYEAMIAAAPAPAAQEQLTDDERAAIEFYRANPRAALFDLKQRMAPAAQDEREALRHLAAAHGIAWKDDGYSLECFVRAALIAPQDAQERNAIIEECAYELLDFYHRSSTRNISDFAAAIRALKTAQPADKPITAQLPDPYDERDGTWFALKDKPEGKTEQHEEQEMTDAEILKIAAENGHGYAGDGKVSPFNGNEDIAEDYISFARALLAAHGVKA